MGQISDFLNDKTPSATPPDRQKKGAISQFLSDAAPPDRGIGGWARDAAAWGTKAAIAVPEAVVGLADIPTGGRVGKALEDAGVRFKDAREAANEWHSDATKQAQRKFQEAEGFGGKLRAAIENPSNIAGAIIESAPSMLAGGVAARGIQAATRLGQMGTKGAVAAGALGEGLMGAGSAAEQIRQESKDGLLTPEQTGYAAATGAATAGFGLLGGKIAQRLGVGDVDTMVAQGAKGMADDAANPLLTQQAAKSIPRQVIEGAISEGLLEELPQSVAEQILQNLALDKPWHEDVDSAAVMGMLSGGAMGAGASGVRAFTRGTPAQDAPADTPELQAPAEPQADPQIDLQTGLQADPQTDLQIAPDAQQGAPAPDLQADALASEVAEPAQAAAQDEGVVTQDDGAITQGSYEDDSGVTEEAANQPAPIKPSEAMGLRAEDGALSAAAVQAVDSGASAQLQQAAALSEAASQAKPAQKSERFQRAKQEQSTQSTLAGQVQAAQDTGINPETGEIAGAPHLAGMTGEQLSAMYRSAQAPEVRRQLAQELLHRRQVREQQAQQSEISTTQKGTSDGAQTHQTQQMAAQGEQARAAQASAFAAAQGFPAAGAAGDVQAAGLTAAPESAPEFTTLQKTDGGSVTVRTADLRGGVQSLATFTEDGKRRAPRVDRASLVLPEQQQVQAGDLPKPTGSFANRMRMLVRTALGRKDGNKAFIEIAPVSDDVAARVKTDAGLDVAGFKHSLDESAIRHIIGSHGNQAVERARGQEAITEDDFARLQEVVASPDKIERGHDTDDGKPTVVFQKSIGGTMYYVQEVRNRRGKLAAKTLWKTRGVPPAAAEAGLAHTSETPARSASTAQPSLTTDGGTGNRQADGAADAQPGLSRDGGQRDVPQRQNARHEQRSRTASGIPAGLPAQSDAESRYLEQRINRWLAADGNQKGRWRANRISAVSLPHALRHALARFTDATGTRVVLFRNLTPQVDDFNGVNFRDGIIYINETSQHPLTLTAAHEWVHNLRKTHPELYQQLEDEVRRQGRLDAWHARNIREEGMDRGRDHAIEELTASAVSDAMTDPQFLQRLAQRNQGLFQRVARAFLEFLDTLSQGWRDQGSNQYLQDVEAFRDKLAAVLDVYERQDGRAGGVSEAMFQRAWHGTPHRGIEDEGFQLNKIGSGEGAQAFGWGIYFASQREVAEGYRGKLSDVSYEISINGDDPYTYIESEGIWQDERGNQLENSDALVAEALRLDDVEGLRDAVQEALEDEDADAVLWQDKEHDLSDAQAALETLDNEPDLFELKEQRGQLYQVEVPEDSDLLDWDKPLSQQPPKVRDALRSLGVDTNEQALADYDDALLSALFDDGPAPGKMPRDPSGQDVYRSLGSPQQASERLLEVGIPGLRYLDGNSRGAGEGSHNYVIWDEALLTPEAAQIQPMYSRRPATKAAYEARIDALFAGQKAAGPESGVRVLDRSDVLAMLGFGDGPVQLAEGKVKASPDNHPHMTAAVWKKVPEWLENPAAVFDSDTVPGSLVLIAPELVAGAPVRMTVKPAKGGGSQVHILTNAYDAHGRAPFGRWLSDGLAYLVDQKTFPAVLEASGLQLPRTAFQNKPGTRRILTEKNLAGWRRSNSAAFMFGGQRAQTANQHALDSAKARIEAGEDAEAVRQDTGWHKGTDGKWRFEIDDSQAQWNKYGLRRKNLTFGDVYDRLRERGLFHSVGNLLKHDRLFAAYPQLRGMLVTPETGVGNASFVEETDAAKRAQGVLGEVRIRRDLPLDEALSSMLHELQHAVQNAEGFARGGSPLEFSDDMLPQDVVRAAEEKRQRGMDMIGGRKHWDGIELQREANQMLEQARIDAYRKLAGEIEARNTQARAGLSADERRATAPSSTQDIADSEAIVLWQDTVLPMPAALAQSRDTNGFAQSAAARARVAQVQERVNAITANWANAPEVVVVHDMQDAKVPKAARDADAAQKSQGGTGEPLGFFHDGKVYIIASQTPTTAAVQQVLFHEALGHYGLQGVFGERMHSILNRVALARREQVKAKARQYGLDFSTPSQRRMAAEEVLAEMAEQNPQMGLVREAIAAIRTWLREHIPGFDNLRVTNDEIIRSYLMPARRFVQQGAGRGDGRQVSFSRQPQGQSDEDKARILQGEPVATVRIEDVPDGGFADVVRWASDLFSRQGGQAVNPVIGTVLLNEQSARDAMGHGGANTAKKAAFAAVKDVIERGALVMQAAHGRQDSFYIAAPVSISGRENVVTVLVRRDMNTQRMYLHSVTLKENLLKPSVSAADAKASEPHSATTSGDGQSIAQSVQGRKADSAEVAAQLQRLLRMDVGDTPMFRRSQPVTESAGLRAMSASAIDQINAAFSHEGTVSWWHKTIGTMRNLAERSPAFKPVFETAQRFIDDVSMLANDAADMAPRLLPKLESWRDLGKRPVSAQDSKAVALPLFEGTLSWGRDVDGRAVLADELARKYASLSADEKAQMMLKAGKLKPEVLKMWRGLEVSAYEKAVDSRFEGTVLKPGVVFSDAELRDLFKATPEQISLYREARRAIDRSIDMTARADMLRAAGDDYAPMRDVVLEAPTLTEAATLLIESMEADAKSDAERRDVLADAMEAVRQRLDSAERLQREGYAPLTRFGRYTLDVVDKDGKRLFFGMYESRRESNIARIQLASTFPGATVTQGTLSEQAFKLFAGVTPESVELFGNMLGLGQGDEAQDKVFQQYIQLTKNNHSAMKRMLHRKGIAGYSEDVGRVLASFVYANARQAAAGLSAGRLDKAINAIPKSQGELKDVAMGLRAYIQEPQEEGQAIRGMLFAQYLGGSVASAFVNMTQPFAVTTPWLSQFGGMRQAAGQMARALKDMGTRGFKYEDDLAKAMKRAEDDGVVSPQEIHMLMAQARGSGSLRSGDGTRSGNARAALSNTWERTKVAWGQPFALAEQFNRRSTFIAAYRIAKAQKMFDPDAFARRAVLETQFLYSRANKPRWARGAVGGALFTFKTYSVSYLELMDRMWRQGGPEGKRAVAWAMVTLMLMGGAGGLPFMEDLEDLIDGVAQVMGYNFSSKQARQQFMAHVLGKELAAFMDQGISGLPGAPVDVSGRLGMGNLLPGTGLFMTKQNRSRDLLEMVGPAGDLVARGFTGAGKVLTGDVAGGVMEMAPTAVRNAAKGADMAATGMYRDSKGYKVLDTTMLEAAAKAIGFQPRSVAQVHEANSFMQRSTSFYRQMSAEIKAQWAKAVFEKDAQALARARQRVEDWNRNNPEQPIRIEVPDIMRRVREMGKDRTQRIADSAPVALRERMREMAAEMD
ncbi:MAG: PLxRFG domain-containing protein [Pseudomonadota bacterium]|nr:PLxRFG domain-containing protein [Pseudomonadota bacterium]